MTSGALSSNASLLLPSQRINRNSPLSSDASKTEMLARMLRTGDPPADAVVQELRDSGREAQQMLDAGVRGGLATLPHPLPGIEAFLRQAETIPSWFDPGLLQRQQTAWLSIEPSWMGIATSLGSLVHTYSSPAIARLLIGTGRLVTMAARRLAETNKWNASVILPGALARGELGYIATLQVRLLHANMRAANLKRGWDVDSWGVPINQVDLVRTWLDFTLVPFRALADLGFDFTDDELSALYEFWRYIAYLLGIDPVLYRDVRDHASAEDLMVLVESTDGPADENSRTLVSALLNCVVGDLMGALNTPPELTVDMVHALARFINGDQVADALGLRHPEVAYLLPLVVHDNQSTRQLQRIVAGAWEQGIERNIQETRAMLTSVAGPATYQTYLSASPRV